GIAFRRARGWIARPDRIGLDRGRRSLLLARGLHFHPPARRPRPAVHVLVRTPVGEGHVHAEAGADLDQERDEQHEAGLHRADIDSNQAGDHARLRVGLAHDGGAGYLGGTDLRTKLRPPGPEFLGLLARGMLRSELEVLLAELATRP